MGERITPALCRPIRHAICLILLFQLACFMWGQQPDLGSKVYADTSKSVFVIIVKSADGSMIGQGSGFLVENGKIITNEHVVRTGRIYIDLGAVKLPATVERADAFNDLAVITTAGELSVKPLPLAAAVPSPGTSVYAIGNPAGLQKTISAGVVSGVRETGGRQLVQITCPISPGSSGGPVLNSRGEVVGVAVGTLERGQNLNFAVPAAFVFKLLRGEISAKGDVISILEKAETLKQKRASLDYSDEPDSAWQKLDRQVDGLLESALERAGDNVELLLLIARTAESQSVSITIAAAERAVRVKPTADGYHLLAKSLSLSTFMSDDKEALLDRAEKAARSALSLAKEPTAEMYFSLGDVLEDRAKTAEALATFRRAFDMSKSTEKTDVHANSTRGLVRTSYALGKSSDGEAWFNTLVATGQAAYFDWQSQAKRWDTMGKYREAAGAYAVAARIGRIWTNWCEAGTTSALAGDDDSTLSYSRKCIEEGTGKKNSESPLAAAHTQIAAVLNSRGVYQEALSHAKEATSLNASNAWSFNQLSTALRHLKRTQEAINAGTQAIRVSDGKYSYMHFQLGLAYFDAENWEFAKQSFEKAAELNTKDDAAPYNVALCNIRLGYFRDAAAWFEEVLRRNPNHGERQDILNQIQRLRR